MTNSELHHFLDSEGKLLSWPAKRKKQLAALRYLAGKLELDKDYTEREINDLLDTFHAFKDAALLRRELYMNKLIDRENDGSRYWKTKAQ